ncbi:MAG: GNAT family N-acetyltransferase [Defluviitaleaceae bacterium]|nr:GNAT family N-acetyltransferase [Defluviitaleaceae bacterium]
MINLQPIIWGNYEEIKKLEIHDHQKEFVDSNIECLAKAYIDWKENGIQSFEYGIYDDNTPIGFVMMEHRSAEHPQHFDKNNPQPYYMIWEFMIDKNHQGKGLGRAAMTAIIGHLKTQPKGGANSAVVIYEPANTIAAKLYASLGFEDTGGRSKGGDIFVQLRF